MRLTELLTNVEKKIQKKKKKIEHSLKYASVNKTSDILKLSLQHLRF